MTRNALTACSIFGLIVIVAASGGCSKTRDFPQSAAAGEGGESPRGSGGEMSGGLGPGGNGSGGMMPGAGTGGTDGGTGGTENGTGGSSEPMTVSCAGSEYPAPSDMGDWGCQDFDGDWPPASPWTLSDSDNRLSVVSDLFYSASNSLYLAVPSSGTANSTVKWSNIGGKDISSVRIEFELHHNTLPAAPPAWEHHLNVACVDFGKVEACLGYAWGNGGYNIQIADYRTIATPTSCNIESAPVPGSWSHIILEMTSTGQVSVQIEEETPALCSGPAGITGTVASAWVGIEGEPDSRQGYFPHLDSLFTLVTRN